MKGKLVVWNPQRGFGFIEVRSEQGYVERFFALARNIIYSEMDIPQSWCPVEFEISDEPMRRSDGYPLAKNIKMFKPQTVAGLEVLAAAPSKLQEGA